jgi:hypothetical protein
MPAPWTLLGTTGVRYVDNKGVNGQVKLAQLSKTAKGTFELKLWTARGQASDASADARTPRSAARVCGGPNLIPYGMAADW